MVRVIILKSLVVYHLPVNFLNILIELLYELAAIAILLIITIVKNKFIYLIILVHNHRMFMYTVEILCRQ